MSVGEKLFLLCIFRPIRVKHTTRGKLVLSLMRVSGRAFFGYAFRASSLPCVEVVSENSISVLPRTGWEYN